MAVRNREMRLLRASKLREVPKSTFKDKVNSKDQNIEKLRAGNIRSCRKPVLLRQILSSFFSGRGCVGKIKNILVVFITSHTTRSFYSFKKGKNEKNFKITIMNTKLLSTRNVFIP